MSNIQLKVNNKIYEKTLVIGNYNGALANKKYRESSWGHFIYPSERLFTEAGVIEEVNIEYPGAKISFAGLRLHWLLINLVLTFVIALAFRKRFGVEF